MLRSPRSELGPATAESPKRHYPRPEEVVWTVAYNGITMHYGSSGGGDETMEHHGFTERDKQRLAQLEKIADKMQDEALKDPRLKRWGQVLGIIAGLAFLCIFFLPHGRGETTWVSYFFFLLAPGAIGLFLVVFYWKSQIELRSAEKFKKGPYGTEYKELCDRRNAAEKNDVGDWLR